MSNTDQDKNLSRKFIQLISKLKLVKPKKQKEAMNNVESPIKILETSKLEEDQSIEVITNYELYEPNETSSKKFKVFCQEVEKFTNYLKDNEDLNYYIYKYPEILQKRVNINVNELQHVLAEIKESMSNIKKLKNQQKLIKKEICAVKKSVPRIRDSEIRELEMVVSHHDKDLYTRWVKSKWKIDAIEELMFDIQEKQIAFDTLNILIKRYLEKNNKTNAGISENSSDKDKTESNLSSTSSVESKIPSPPPIPTLSLPRPVSLTVNVLNKNNNNNQHSWVQRRFRAERRGNLDAVNLITENSERIPYVLQLNENNNARNNINYSGSLGSQSRYSSSSNENMYSSNSNNQTDTSSNNTTQFQDETDLKTQIQSVLQALFGQRTVPLMITENNNNPTSDINIEDYIELN